MTFHTTTNPGAGNDETQGFLVDGTWRNTATKKTYICADASAAAAVWRDVDDLDDFFIGAMLETHSITVTESGGTVSLTLEQAGGGDLTLLFSDGEFVLVTTPALSVDLTAGTSEVGVVNYIYVPQSTKLLTVGSSWPVTEHSPIAKAVVQDAAGVADDGVRMLHAWTDHVALAGDNGHLSHMNKRLRIQATWISGIDPTLTITPNGGAPDDLIFTSVAGVVSQAHDHAVPAFSGTPDIFVVNDPDESYAKITNLNVLLEDALGGSLSNRRFSLVLWANSSEVESYSKLNLNLPSGSYNSSSGVIADDLKYSNYSIPPESRETGVLVAEYKLRHQPASGGTWTLVSAVDLRGLQPSISAGAGSPRSAEFPDTAFRVEDDVDATKQIAFQAAAIATATTRTVSMPDRDVTLGAGLQGVTVVAGTAYTVLATDDDKIIKCTSGSAVTLSIDTGDLPIGFACAVVQWGAGQVDADGGTATIRKSAAVPGTKTSGQYARIELVVADTDEIVISGDAAA